TILFEPGDEMARQFVAGYQDDRFFCDKWKQASSMTVPRFQGQAFQRDERGLLYMRIGDDEPKLCVPRTMVPTILAHTHDSPLFSAHEG
ncbi:hypothetical protein FOMPIDRAFT_1082883, partial [Fomitopsis schrenkii]